MKDIKTTVYIKPKQTPGFTSILSELCQSFSPGTRAPWCGIPQSLHSLRVQAYYIMVPCVNNADTLMWSYEGAQQSRLIAAFGVQWYNHSPWVLSQPRSVSSTIWTPGEKQPDTLTHNGGLDISPFSENQGTTAQATTVQLHVQIPDRSEYLQPLLQNVGVYRKLLFLSCSD